jgi:transcriptional regulator with XRE-family HTH domain
MKKPIITIGDRVLAARQKLKLTQFDVAKASGLRPETIGKIEKGRSRAELASLHALCPVLGLTIEELVSNDQPGKAGIKEKKK